LAYNEGKVKIGKYSFVGPHAVITPGTTIGKGSLVSAYSFVKGSFPDYAIISGNPAVIVGDTRDRDKKWLDQNEALQANYKSWNEV
jgi:acetyltransferase-like isoleucine patch superfamily enzyme